MNDVAPILLPLAEPPRPDRRILATAAVSVLVHLLVLGWILLPRAPTTQAEEPKSIAVELVPPSAVSSIEPSISSQPPPSAEEPSSEASSSAPSAEPSSAMSSEAPSSAQPSSAESASSAEQPSSAAPSSAPSSTPPPSASSSGEAPSSAETASASSSASQPPPQPRSKPTVIPVGPGASASEEASSFEDASASQDSSAASAISSAEASSAEASTAPVLTASGENGEGADQATASGSSEAASASAEGAPPPPASDLLHAAKRFYLSEMLDKPGLANARAALKKLPPEKRLAQTCNIEAVGQIGKARGDYAPDAVVANAFAPTSISGTTYSVASGAFRSNGKWYGIAYECTLNKDLSAVSSFAFHIGDNVTKQMVARYGGG